MRHYRVIVFNDFGIMLDDTEVNSNNKEQVRKIAESMLKSTSGSEYSEVWNDKRMTMKFVITRKGNVKSVNVEHPNWGGYRPGAGAHLKNRPILYPHTMNIRVSEEMYDKLQARADKSDFIRSAIQEKFERECNNQETETLDK